MSQSNSAKPCILIVDDNTFLRSMFTLVAKEEGYETLEAANGEECLIKYSLFEPDLILLDVLMPDMDGFTCCQKLRELMKNGQAAILMITALDDPASINRAFDVGADDYITKPINWEVLKRRIKRLLLFQHNLQKKETAQQQVDYFHRWESFIYEFVQFLRDCRQSSLLSEDILHKIRVYFQITRIITIATSPEKLYIETFAEDNQLLEAVDLVLDIIKNFPQDSQNLIATIEEVSKNDSRHRLLTLAQSKSLIIVPILPKNKSPIYLILISREQRHWLPREINQIHHISNILSLGIN